MNEYFSGWYYKCQNSSDTLAIIPAYHKTNNNYSASIQIITSDQTWNLPFSFDSVRFNKNGSFFSIGKNRFTKKEIRLDIHQNGCTAYGFLKFGPLTPIAYDIMGPFSMIPFMECRHRIPSMRHSVSGALMLNGKPYVFSDDSGYIEGDCGRSFPKAYAWTHCFFPEGSLSLSVAEIPLAGIRFTGIICLIHWHGKEYRLATYLGARLVQWKNGTIAIRQGKYRLTARLLSSDKPTAHPLHAPVDGAMARTIHEHPACRAYYQFSKEDKTLFSFVSEKASFEYESPS